MTTIKIAIAVPEALLDEIDDAARVGRQGARPIFRGQASSP
jgi:hypothetical protein